MEGKQCKFCIPPKKDGKISTVRSSKGYRRPNVEIKNNLTVVSKKNILASVRTEPILFLFFFFFFYSKQSKGALWHCKGALCPLVVLRVFASHLTARSQHKVLCQGYYR